MVGFVQDVKKPSSMAQHSIQCFHGVQKKHYDIEKTKTYDNGKVKYNKIIETNDIKPVDLLSTGSSMKQSKAQQRTSKRRNLHLEHKPSDEMDLLISEVNSMDIGWKADTCKY